MKIEHIALWVDDLETMRHFYVTYFGACCGELYINSGKQYQSYFLSFGSGARIELMTRPDITAAPAKRGFQKGWAHLAFTLGTKQAVDQLTDRLRKDGFTIASELRTTGDGYYESAVLDPEGNYVELLA